MCSLTRNHCQAKQLNTAEIMKGNQQDIHELTRIEAFLLSEKAGHPSHMHDYFWSQAEAIVRQRAAIVAVAVKVAGKKKPAAAKTTGKTKKTVQSQLSLEPAPAPAVPKPKKVPTAKKAAPVVKKAAKKAK